jgi:VanZ family protein
MADRSQEPKYCPRSDIALTRGALPVFAECFGGSVLSLTSTFRTAWWVGLAAIVVLSLVPGSERPQNALGLPGQYEHLLAYMLTAGAFGLAYRKTTIRVALLALLVICAALLETAQIWIPGRTARLIDFGTSSTGAGLGLLVAAVLDHLVSPSLDGEPMDRERKPEPRG